MEALPFENINAKIQEINARQSALNEQGQKARARFESMRQAYSQEMQTLQTEFTENVGALKTLQALLPQDGEGKS